MIHIATVHWKDNRWIDVQLAYLRRHVTEPFQVYAWLNDVPGDHRGKYYYTTTEPVADHAVKLNVLADIIYANSDKDKDLLIFLDGDAFPIGDTIEFVRTKLHRHPLVAIQRRENNGDVQPHPCFCATTIGFWKRIGGDWKQGDTWPDAFGNPTTDVGGNLLGILQRLAVDWWPLLRCNKVNLHPLWFGVYEGLIYHHGAGFRDPLSRHDVGAIALQLRRTWKSQLARAIDRVCYSHSSLRRLERFSPRHTLERQAANRNREMILRVYESILGNPLFYQTFA